MDSIIVMPGSARADFSPLDAIAGEFGWDVRTVHHADEVAAAKSAGSTLAVLICRDALGPGSSWSDAIQFLGVALPGTPVIVVHGFADPFDWPVLTDSGAFHSLWLPLKPNEVRQSLGFLLRAGRPAFCLPAWTLTPPVESASLNG